MNVKDSNRGSWLWKSLLWGRQLINLGSRWRIGSGTEVFIYFVRWIPRNNPFKVFSSPVLGELALVSDLIDGVNGWNKDLIYRSFCQADADAIMGLPLSSVGLKDKIIWHDDIWGNYSVKSGYKVGMRERNAGAASSSGGVGFDWKLFWRISVPNKMKILVWRAWNDWIPTALNLFAHHVPVNPICEFCKNHADSTLHALWGCSRLKDVRKECGFVMCPSFSIEGDFKSLLWECQRSLSNENFELLCVVFWRSWHSRNKAKLQKDCSRSVNLKMEVVDWSRAMLAEFHGVAGASVRNSVSLSKNRGWRKPSRGCFKVNTDAALCVEECNAGLGIVVRDADGLVLAARAKRLSGTFSPQVAELMAMVEGLKLISRLGLPRTTLESDAKVLVDIINSSMVPSSDVGILVLEIHRLISSSFIQSVIFVPRTGNQVAHSLAKLALKDGGDSLWFDDCHVGVMDLVQGDACSIP